MTGIVWKWTIVDGQWVQVPRVLLRDLRGRLFEVPVRLVDESVEVTK